MDVHTAQLAGGTHSADRVFMIDNAVIVLDGATALEPVDIDPATYADVLGQAIAENLTHDPCADLGDAVAAAIAHTAAQLHLATGQSPSSTVAILRIRDTAVDLYVLGDSPINYGSTDRGVHRLVDDRLSCVASIEQTRYTEHLRNGGGYSADHRARLIALQRAQRAVRNTPAGYWIAETDPEAAHQGVTATLAPSQIVWAVLATDGIADHIDHNTANTPSWPTWPEIAASTTAQLKTLLDRLHAWERDIDPEGCALPRAKRHDDKTVVAIPAIWQNAR